MIQSKRRERGDLYIDVCPERKAQQQEVLELLALTIAKTLRKCWHQWRLQLGVRTFMESGFRDG